MKTHKHLRTYTYATSAQEMEVHVTLAGPSVAAPSTKTEWQRPLAVEPVYRTIIAPKIASRDLPKFDPMTEKRNGKTMAECVAAERRRYHAAEGREKGQSIRKIGKSPKQLKYEASILAALEGEMTANELGLMVGSETASVATALGRMIDEGLVTRRYHIAQNRQVGIYRRTGSIGRTTEG